MCENRGANAIQQWAKRKLVERRRLQGLELRKRRQETLDREKFDAIQGVMAFEDERR